MDLILEKPTDPYSPDWVEYAHQNPGLRRSLSAADPEDLSTFVPESFKGEDGTYDLDGFRTAFDEGVSFKAQADEAAEALPKDADGYVFAVGEEHILPEGFDPEVLRQPVLNEDGTPKMGEDGQPEMKDFDVNDMVSADDPDLPLLQAALLKHGANPALMGDIAGIMANREISTITKAVKIASEQKAALGPNGQSRIDTVKRSIASKLPDAQTKAVMDSITSADALKGIETILKTSKSPPAAALDHKIDNSTASINERISAGLKARKSA